MPEEPAEPEDDASVLTPEELELEDEREDAVRKIGENRYVIRPNEDAPDDDSDSEASRPGPLADAGEQSSPSPDSQAHEDAGSRGGASEPSLADERSSSSRGSASSRQAADAREDAEAQGASSPRSQAHEDAPEHSSASPASASPQQDAAELRSASSRSTSSRETTDDRAAPNVDVESRALALERAAGEYGIDAVVDTGDGVVERRLVADDQIAVFEEFLRWYARQIDPDASPAATISALLAEADLSE